MLGPIHSGRAQSLAPKNGWFSADADAYVNIIVRNQYVCSSSARELETIVVKDRLENIAIDRLVKTRRAIRIFHRLLTVRNNEFHDRKSAWAINANMGP